MEEPEAAASRVKEVRKPDALPQNDGVPDR